MEVEMARLPVEPDDEREQNRDRQIVPLARRRGLLPMAGGGTTGLHKAMTARNAELEKEQAIFIE